MRAIDAQVRKGKLFQEHGIVEDSGREPRPELAVAVAVPSEGADAELDALGDPLTIREVARLIGCSVWTVRQQCLRQGLPHFRASRSGRLIFYRSQVVRWLIEKQNERRW
jgi:Helix-turn-helix domain